MSSLGCALKEEGSLSEISFTLKKFSFDNWRVIGKIISKYFAKSELQKHFEEYKGRYNAYSVMTKIVASKFFRYASGETEDPVCQEIQIDKIHTSFKMKLDVGRRIGELTLRFVEDLWEIVRLEFELLPYSAQINAIMEGCLEIVWCILCSDAEKIRSSAQGHLEFFRNHSIILVAIDGDIIYTKPDIDLLVSGNFV